MYMPLAAAPTWLSFALIILIINDSNSIWSVPGFTLPAHRAHHHVSAHGLGDSACWQFAVSIGLLIVSIWAALWFSPLYRVGILMYGKRATLPELLRWLRYS